MTIHNAIKYAPLLQRAAGAATGLAGEESGVERLSETLSPSIDLWAQPEWAFLRGERLCAWSRFQAAAGAGTLPGVSLSNTTDNLLVVVEAASCVGAAGQFQLWMALDADITPGAFPASSQGASRDRRNAGTTSLAVLRYGTPAAPPTGQVIETRQTAILEALDFNALPIVLAKGQACFILSTTPNIPLFVNFRWRERRLFPSEQARG